MSPNPKRHIQGSAHLEVHLDSRRGDAGAEEDRKADGGEGTKSSSWYSELGKQGLPRVQMPEFEMGRMSMPAFALPHVRLPSWQVYFCVLFILHRAFLPPVTKMLVQMNRMGEAQSKLSGDVGDSDTCEGSNLPAPTSAGRYGAQANHGATHRLQRPVDEICEIPGTFCAWTRRCEISCCLHVPLRRRNGWLTLFGSPSEMPAAPTNMPTREAINLHSESSDERLKSYPPRGWARDRKHAGEGVGESKHAGVGEAGQENLTGAERERDNLFGLPVPRFQLPDMPNLEMSKLIGGGRGGEEHNVHGKTSKVQTDTLAPRPG